MCKNLFSPRKIAHSISLFFLFGFFLVFFSFPRFFFPVIFAFQLPSFHFFPSKTVGRLADFFGSLHPLFLPLAHYSVQFFFSFSSFFSKPLFRFFKTIFSKTCTFALHFFSFLETNMLNIVSRAGEKTHGFLFFLSHLFPVRYSDFMLSFIGFLSFSFQVPFVFFTIDISFFLTCTRFSFHYCLLLASPSATVENLERNNEGKVENEERKGSEVGAKAKKREENKE